MHKAAVYIPLALGLVQIGIVGFVIGEVLRLGVSFTRLACLLVLLFAVDGFEGVMRAPVLRGMRYHTVLEMALDVAAVLILIGVLLHSRGAVRAVLASLQVAAHHTREYERALHDYTQVMRHRIMNPVAVIRLAALALRDDAIQSSTARQHLIDIVIESTRRIEEMSFDPKVEGEEEEMLHAIPAPSLVGR